MPKTLAVCSAFSICILCTVLCLFSFPLGPDIVRLDGKSVWYTTIAFSGSDLIPFINNVNNTRLTALCPVLLVWASTRKVKPIWILLKQETVCGINWAICKSASHPRQIPVPAPHHSGFYRPDALPATQTTASKHWRQINKYIHYKWQQDLSWQIRNELQQIYHNSFPVHPSSLISPKRSDLME